MKDQLIEVLPEEVAKIAENVSAEKRNEVQTVLNQVFNGVSRMREQLDSITVADENDELNMKLARTIRLSVREVRLKAEKTFDAKRSEVQQAMLSYKTEDQLWLKSKQTMQILTKEIEEHARWKEETRQRFEAEQKEIKVQQRMVQVSKFAPELSRSEFENMGDESFKLFLAGLEKKHNDKLEAERKAEEERIAKEKAERKAEEKRIAKEKAERKAEEKRIAKEKAELKAEEERIAKEKAELKAEEERIAKEKAERKAEEERIAKEKAELKAEEERIAKEKADAELRAAKAPRKEKLNVWVNSFNVPQIPKEMDADKIIIEITEKFEMFKKWAKGKIEAL